FTRDLRLRRTGERLAKTRRSTARLTARFATAPAARGSSAAPAETPRAANDRTSAAGITCIDTPVFCLNGNRREVGRARRNRRRAHGGQVPSPGVCARRGFGADTSRAGAGALRGIPGQYVHDVEPVFPEGRGKCLGEFCRGVVEQCRSGRFPGGRVRATLRRVGHETGRRVPGQYIYVRGPEQSQHRDGRERKLRGRLAEQESGRPWPGRLRAALRQLRRAPGERVPRQYVYDR